MKTRKIIFSLLIFALLFSALTLTSAASNKDEITVSEDYSSVMYNGERYLRVDPLRIFVLDYGWVYDITFEGTGKNAVQSSDAYINDTAIELNVTYNDGGSGYYIYIKESLISDYNSFIINGGSTYELDTFMMKTLEIDSSALLGKQMIVKGYELNYYEYVGEISSFGFNGDVEVINGYVMSNAKDEYFYVDYQRSAIEDNSSELTMHESVSIWQITDAGTVSDIRSFVSTGPSIGGDIDFENGEGFVFGLIVFVTVLGAVPLVAGIISFVASLKADKPYKILLRVISALCAAIFVITIVTMIICLAAAVV